MQTVKKALTIAGSDSGGGAGIQADLKTFQELGVYGMSAITAITAQNTLGVQNVYPLPVEAIVEQMDAIGEDIGTDAVKTGMLFSAELIEAVAAKIKQWKWTQLVVDPVMIAKGGAKLLQDEAVDAVKKHLLPLAALVTPNLPEAEVLTGMDLSTNEARKDAAKKLHEMGARNVMIKGGHASDASAPDVVVDLLYDGETFVEFSGRRIDTKNTHGTGCTFSAAIAAGLAKGESMEEAVRTAKAFIQAAIEHSIDVGHGHGPTNHWAYNKNVQA